ncbi:MAG: TetR/AcrR family transcriptional regulator [Chloroflexi bacterium]|nr:TetR/AcrR family transcriptional regulator [Chloroflexota bacterium]
MPRARRLPAEDRRRQIIESAREVFASQSFAKVGTADLAKAVGVSEPALYRYFSGKKDLFLATLRSTAPKLLELWQNIASDVEDPLETLWSIGVDYYDHLQSHSGNMRLQFQAISEAHDPEIREALRENFASFVDFVAETLDEGKRRGIVRRDIDSRLMAWQFLGIGLTLDLMHLLGFSSELDRSKMEQWGRLYGETLRAPRQRSGVGPGVRAVSELVPSEGWPPEA